MPAGGKPHELWLCKQNWQLYKLILPRDTAAFDQLRMNISLLMHKLPQFCWCLTVEVMANTWAQVKSNRLFLQVYMYMYMYNIHVHVYVYVAICMSSEALPAHSTNIFMQKGILSCERFLLM